MKALDVAMKATPARWWATHKENIGDWSQCKTSLKIRFFEDMEYVRITYTGQSSPRDHVELCIFEWQEVPQQEWVHDFISTLDIVLNNLYVDLELR